MNIETRQAYSEVNAFLQLIDSDMSNKIPKKLKNFFKREMDKKYQPVLKKNIPLKEQNLRRKTIAIISSLYLQYWCIDMSKKEELLKTYKNNEIKANHCRCRNGFRNNKHCVSANFKHLLKNQIGSFRNFRYKFEQH